MVDDLGYFDGKDSVDVRVLPEDFKDYLKESISKLNRTILQKQTLIHQTEAEINEITKQIDQYSYLLENEELLIETLEKAAAGILEKLRSIDERIGK